MIHETHDLGRLFCVFLKVAKGSRVVSYAPTWEQDPPYRFGPTIVIRLPFGRAVGFGFWLRTDVGSLELAREERAEIESANAAYDAYVAVNGEVPREEWDEVRKQISGMGLDPEEEMAIMQEMGVFGGDR